MPPSERELSDAATLSARSLGARSLGLGVVLAERYELTGHLGSGGMGSVYRAHDRELAEDVALKVLHHDLVSEQAIERFRREVRLARRVTHPAVARTYDLGVHPGMRFLTMELVEGPSLRSRTGTPLPLSEALRIAASVACGLAAAHGQGITHRDLKPENVLLSQDRVVVTDFGIARSDSEQGLTQDAIVGTPAYMAPEQVEARSVDGRADVFALGVVLFELLTGRLPFVADTPVAMAFARLLETAPDPRALRPDLPDGVSSLVRAMLARQRETRPDGQTVADRLDELRGGAALAAPVSRPQSILSMETPTGLGQARSVSVAAVDAPASVAAQGEDLGRAVADALAMDSRVRVVPSGGDLSLVLELRASGERVRARWRVCSRGGTTVAAGHQDGTTSDPFDLEDRVVAETTTAVRERLAARRSPRDPALRARWDEAFALYQSGEEASLRRAVELFSALAEEAPDDPVVLALAAVATLRRLIAHYELDELAAARAEELAIRAHDADPTLPEAYEAIAMVRALFGDFRSAFVAAREVAARSPGFADAHVDLGRILFFCGQMRDAIARVELGLRLGPAGLFAAKVLFARLLFLAGEAPRARALLDEMRPAAPRALAETDVRFAVWAADREAARAPAATLEARYGTATDIARAARAWAEGESCLALVESSLVRLRSAPGQRRPSPRLVGQVITLAVELLVLEGRLERALEVLSESCDAFPFFVDLAWLDGSPPVAPLRAEPRYAAVRAQMALRAAAIVA